MTTDETPDPDAVVDERATGDDALAAGMALVLGTYQAKDLDQYDNQTRDYLANGHTFWKPSLPPVPIAKGGTGANSPDAARSALGAASQADMNARVQNLSEGVNEVALRWSSGRLVPNIDGTDQGALAFASEIPGSSSGLADGPTSAAYNRGTTGSGYFAVWMNAQLQFMRNTSSRRFKENIRDWAGGVLGLRPRVFDRIDGDPDEVGLIAEEVLEVLPEAVVYLEDEIDGINDRVLLVAAIAEIQRLHARLTVLEGGDGAP